MTPTHLPLTVGTIGPTVLEGTWSASASYSTTAPFSSRPATTLGYVAAIMDLKGQAVEAEQHRLGHRSRVGVRRH